MPEQTPIPPIIQKLKTSLKWLSFLMGLFLAVLSISRPYYTLLPPPYFDILSAEENDNFNKIPIDMDHSGSGYFPVVFYPLINTPYIFCRLNDTNFNYNEKFQQRFHKNLVIDGQQGTLVLHAGWENHFYMNGRRMSPKSMIKNLGIYTTNGQPHLLFKRDAYLIPDTLQPLSFLPAFLLYAIINPQQEMWTMDIQGNLQKRKILKHNLFKQEIIRPSDFSKIAGLNHDRIYEYKITNDEFKEIHHWPEFGSSYAPNFQLPNGGYLLNQKKKNSSSIAFLYPNHPQITKFTFNSLFELLPGPAKSRRYSSLIPLSFTENETLLAYIQTPSFPIFEFYPGQFGQELFGKKVRFVGYGGKLQPLLAFDNNRSILFEEQFGNHNNIFPRNEFSSMRLFTVRTDSLPSREIALPTDTIKCYKLPFYARISITPLDESHLLAFSQGTFWSFKLDGSEVKQIFPRSPSLNLPPALPETPATLSKPVLDPRITYKDPTPEININPFQGLINEINKQKPLPPYPLLQDDGLENNRLKK